MMKGLNLLLLLFCLTIRYSEALLDNHISVGMNHLLRQKCGVFSSYSFAEGLEVLPGSKPWMALLKFPKANGGFTFKCTGTLITARFILTAATCLEYGKPISVRLGEHQISTESDCRFVRGRMTCFKYMEFAIEKIFKHEKYQSDSNVNDIALIKLAKAVKLTSTLTPICLPLNETLQDTPNNFDYLGYYSITGWGILEKPQSSDVLQETIALPFDLDYCVDSYNMNFTDTQLCAGSESREECNGDLGGPLSLVDIFLRRQRVVQFGITSLGLRDCINGHPSVFTNVGKYINWIAHIIGSQL